MKLENKLAIVTGASTGIGQEIAIKLASFGTNLILVARRKEKLEETQKLVEKAGSKAILFPSDLSSLDSTNSLISNIKKARRKIDIVVNVAGIWHGQDEVYANKNFESFPQKTILDTFSVGLIAPSLIIHGLIPQMPKNSKIINISGTFESGAKGWVPYFVSKRAIEDLTIALAQDLKEKNIQVNCISPSDTATEQYKKYFSQYIEDAIDPKKIAEFVADLCQDDKTTGKVFVLKKAQKPFEGFHY